MLKNLLVKHNGGVTGRFHTVSVINRQSVGEHTYGVLCVLHTIWPTASPQLMWSCIFHDTMEQFVGDLPATTKWRWPKISELHGSAEAFLLEGYSLNHQLTIGEKEVLKWCDMAELVLYSLREYRMGNREMLKIADRGLSYLSKLVPPTVRAGRLLKELSINIGLER